MADKMSFGPNKLSRLSSPQLSTVATIGMLTAGLSGPTEIELWHGVADQAQERGINLICF